MMLEVFKSIKHLMKLDTVCIDNFAFRMHKITAVILVAFSLVVTLRQYIGDPIDCIADGIPGDIMDTYCWIHSTYSLPDESEIVDADSDVEETSKPINERYHKYYQWVYFVLFFQAMLFYVPRYLWKTWEGGSMKMLVSDFSCLSVDEDKKRQRKKLVVDYFISNMYYPNVNAFGFFFCEILNCVNVLGQIYFMDIFLGSEFSSYGSDVLSFVTTDPIDRVDPMAKIFPKVTKCSFNKYGPTGNIVEHDGLCILPLNVVNEKIYIFLWFWFIIMALVSGVALIYRAATILSSKFRFFLLKWKSDLVDHRQVQIIVDKCGVNQWFMLYQMGKNMDLLIYCELLSDIASRFEVFGV